ncbi:hypothetical protein C1I98_34240 [Spongiactinospora gelatinilytica]|uniref:Uncharacterized protein n=1 Tax=Spongiactinospora gelatinilytica TaxID=2666298 RepID=A0A2W2GGG0_9ACTN|nr:hypothetical protein C1I98_34240 [Spongiactinospora gelatinilytica]
MAMADATAGNVVPATFSAVTIGRRGRRLMALLFAGGEDSSSPAAGPIARATAEDDRTLPFPGNPEALL